ncbi:class I SAM-dependent methyltransferase [Hazenella coriacea]|uniref:Methyltransferase family protein n=1 Tax=Hazenella coriacea TaxID=1179467 RepID=A0A4R3L7G7_9BACL|nr:class I SAM-dependent methyltransferase [Hazenella coriacea]TCS94975.1 methyltransferase family protein [Hazenella coriacea]
MCILLCGHIADELLKTGVAVDVIEIDYDLRQILEAKGHHLVEWNFLEFKEKEKYDRIIMNPPFEHGQDIDHIKHAYNLLKPGGIVVALMSEGPFFRQDRKSKEWRNFLDEIDGSTQKLTPNAFRESDRPTGVQIRLVTLQKPHSPSKTPSYDQSLAV